MKTTHKLFIPGKPLDETHPPCNISIPPMKISQSKSGTFKVIRIAYSGGSKCITDRIAFASWQDAVNLFCLQIKAEHDGCTWEIICPDGQIGAKAEF